MTIIDTTKYEFFIKHSNFTIEGPYKSFIDAFLEGAIFKRDVLYNEGFEDISKLNTHDFSLDAFRLYSYYEFPGVGFSIVIKLKQP
jgi:hypothetical protein